MTIMTKSFLVNGVLLNHSLILFSYRISSDMAEHYAGSKDYDKAIKSYKEALFYNEADTSVSIIF